MGVLLDRRHFLSASAAAATAAAVPGVAFASGADGAIVHSGRVEAVLSPTTLSLSIRDVGGTRSVTLAPGVMAVHGRAGSVATVESFVVGELVAFAPRDGTLDAPEILASELSSFVEGATLTITGASDDRTGVSGRVVTSSGTFEKSANLTGSLPSGPVGVTYWVHPQTGDRYVCSAVPA